MGNLVSQFYITIFHSLFVQKLFKFSEVREALRLMEFDVVKAKMLQGDDRMQFLVRELESLLQ